MAGRSSRVDTGHAMPLATTWCSGADTWGHNRRTHIATTWRSHVADDLDHSQLLAVSARSNRSQPTRGAGKALSQGKPPAEDDWWTHSCMPMEWTDVNRSPCTPVEWIDVNIRPAPTVTAAQQSALGGTRSP
ncbi:MAG TPA: hypothetical protein VFV02_08245, partial [Acidimicrobiales bacterium]|nr:hypothetical protein [Acidimicrobiales bacterium]